MAATSSLYASNEAIFQERIFTASTTWSPPFNCRAYVTVIGAGGSGGSARQTTSGDSYAAAGGGAGGCAKSLLVLDSSVTYTITIGAGGASVNDADGNNGGANSVFSGTGISTMTANLGNGGPEQISTTTVATQAGGAGGSASGGTIWNVTGGAGGSATISYHSTSGGHGSAGGGGAAGILGEAFRGGNALCSTAGYNKLALAGGAGVGGRGGDATVTGGNGSGANSPNLMGWGGMGFRDGPDLTLSTAEPYGAWFTAAKSGINSSVNNYELLPWLTSSALPRSAGYQRFDTPLVSQGMTTSIFHGLNGCSGGTHIAEAQRFSGPGAGGSGYWSAASVDYTYAAPGLFGGGAGSSNNYYDEQYGAVTGYGARGSFGAGGGAIASYCSSSNTTNSGAGGPGLVVITILEVL